MKRTFSTIEQYIASVDKEKQAVLWEVLHIIRGAAPPETTETISYNMPTLRYHGNLIHFALFNSHLGIYPGPGAILHFASRLGDYKTSKGTIRFPLDKPLPKELIEDIVLYTADQLKNKKGGNWDQYRSQWSLAEERMQEIIIQTPLKKEFKWGTHVYTFRGKNVVAWGGFKSFFSIWFYNGVFLEDKEKVLVNASEGKTKSLRQWRFTRAEDMDEKKILAYINESIQTIKDGKELKPQKSVHREAEGILKAALDSSPQLQAAFRALTPGKRKEYIEYIDEAKQEKTKLSRLEKITPLILQGKGLHDQYRKKI